MAETEEIATRRIALAAYAIAAWGADETKAMQAAALVARTGHMDRQEKKVVAALKIAYEKLP
jgi:hypothetical protein